MSERVADRVKHLLEGNGEQILETSGTVMPHTTLGNKVKSQVTLEPQQKHDNRPRLETTRRLDIGCRDRHCHDLGVYFQFEDVDLNSLHCR